MSDSRHIRNVTPFNKTNVTNTGSELFDDEARFREGVWLINEAITADMRWGLTDGGEVCLLPARGSGVGNPPQFVPIKRGPIWIEATDAGPHVVSGFYY